VLQPRLGQSNVPALSQIEELQGLGQGALDPGACRVALAPFLCFLLAPGFLERLMLGTRPEGEVARAGLGLGALHPLGTMGTCP
jgi:hypothetical protein